MSKLRSPEQKSKKMLNEEKMIIDLELAIKKEQFRKTQKTKPQTGLIQATLIALIDAGVTDKFDLYTKTVEKTGAKREAVRRVANNYEKKILAKLLTR